MTKYEAHPFADLFPMMDESTTAWAGLVSDIKSNGLNRTIVLYEDKILDGRNRERACRAAGVTPRYIQFEKAEKKTSDPLAFVWSENFHRRHLEPGQAAVALARQTAMMSAIADRAKAAASTAHKAREAAKAATANGKTPSLATSPKMVPPTPPPKPAPAVQLHHEAAKIVGVSPRTMQAALTFAKAERGEDKMTVSAPVAKAFESGLLPVESAAQLVRHPVSVQREVMQTFKKGERMAPPAVRSTILEFIKAAEAKQAVKEMAALPATALLDLRVGDWRTALVDVKDIDAIIVDPPYGATTHEAETTRKDGSSAKGLTPSYTGWTAKDVREFVLHWAPRCKGWMVALTSHDLLLAWQEAYRAAGLYAFAPVPCVIKAMSVRMQGDGPSSWSVYSIAARPTKGKDRNGREYSKWGTLPGAYVGTSGRACKEWETRDKDDNPLDITDSVDAGGGRGKPLWLMGKLVSDYSRPGDIVCDPMAGWGSTAIAARMLGRKAVGADIDAEAIAEAQKRATKLNVKG